MLGAFLEQHRQPHKWCCTWSMCHVTCHAWSGFSNNSMRYPSTMRLAPWYLHLSLLFFLLQLASDSSNQACNHRAISYFECCSTLAKYNFTSQSTFRKGCGAHVCGPVRGSLHYLHNTKSRCAHSCHNGPIASYSKALMVVEDKPGPIVARPVPAENLLWQIKSCLIIADGGFLTLVASPSHRQMVPVHNQHR